MHTISVYLFFASTMGGTYLPGGIEIPLPYVSLDMCAKNARSLTRITVGIDSNPKISSAKASHVVGFCAIAGKHRQYLKQYRRLLKLVMKHHKPL